MKPVSSWFFRVAVWLFVLLVVLLLFVFPLLTGFLVKMDWMPMGAGAYLRAIEVAQVYLMRVLGLIWIFFLGSCFASFLNVVAWRVPRGRGINGSSKCPYCNTRLGLRDNVPIVGWLRNRGRCRTCRLPISPRYLIVEIFLGAVFLLLGTVELLLGGINLPLRPVEHFRGFEFMVLDPKWDLIQLLLFQLILTCLLFTFALIRSERLKVPISVFVTGLVFGIGLPLIWPDMLLVSWQIDVDQLIPLERFSLNQTLTLVLGLAAGLIGGAILDWSLGERRSLKNGSPPPNVVQTRWIPIGLAGMAMIGLYLGWQSVLSVSIITFMITDLQYLKSGQYNNPVNLSSKMFLATLIHLLCWRGLTWIEWWPGPTANWVVIAIAGLGILGLAVLGRWSGTRSPS